MDLLAVIGFIILMYYLLYLIVPCFLDCDLHLAFIEKFGKPVDSLKGKVIWIVGASSGIGEHLAYALVKTECKLILSARREAELERIKKQCLNDNKNLKENDIEILVLDICDTKKHKPAFDAIINKFGKLDILVNNAGRSQRAQWENIELDVDKEMFDLNVFSYISLSRIVVKYFLEKGSGHIAITSSLAGMNGLPFSASYCASKHALHGYYNSLRLEKLDKNIAITIVCPGPTQTDFLAESFTEKFGEKYGKSTEISDSKVTAKRCATLMAIAIANKMSDVWIVKPPILQLTYLNKYFPNFGEMIIKSFGSRYLQRLRDAKDF